MQSSKEVRKTNRDQFAWIYKVFCQERCVKPLPAVQAHLQENSLRFCADCVDLKNWSPILNSIAENRNLSKICIYSRSRCRKIREKVNTEEKLAKLWRCGGKDRTWPILYTNFLLRCLVDSVAVFARDSSTITSIALDGITLTPKYLNTLCSGLKKNRSLRNLSLAKCRIGDTGCDLLLGNLRDNLSLCALNLSSCHLTNRSAMCLSLFLKNRKASLLQNVWRESPLQSQDGHEKEHQGLHTLILNKNYKFGDNGVRQLTYILKSDFWLKALNLRHCGITKHGGETIVELLQTNSVLTKMDLTENDIPSNILQIVTRILKRRQEKGERISLRKRLPNWKHISRNISEKKRTYTTVSEKGKHLVNPMERYTKHSTQTQQSKKTHRIFRSKKKAWKMKNENSLQTLNSRELKSQLSDLIRCNSKLKDELSNNKFLLETEIRERTIAERQCQKLTPQLNCLKSKAIIVSCLSTKASGESQLLQSLRYVFENLETLSGAKQLAITSMSEDEKAVLREVQPRLSSGIKQLQRRPYCPPLKIS